MATVMAIRSRMTGCEDGTANTGPSFLHGRVIDSKPDEQQANGILKPFRSVEYRVYRG